MTRGEQRVDERGLAGADLTDQHRESARLAEAPFERRQSFPMPRAHVEHGRRGIELERSAREPEVFVIHRAYNLSSRIATVLSPVSLKIEAVEQIFGSYSSDQCAAATARINPNSSPAIRFSLIRGETGSIGLVGSWTTLTLRILL